MKYKFPFGILAFTVVLIITFTSAFSQQVTDAAQKGRYVIITLKEAFDTKVTITPFDGLRAVKSVAEFNGLRKGESCKLFVPEQYLPGEFVLRLDYRNKESDTPYPSEKNIFINQQDIELSINPPYCNNGDSAKFKEGEMENTVYNSFMLVNIKKRMQIDLLKQFLLAYDQPEAKMYKIGCKEFEKRRNEYNQWLKNQTKSNQGLFVSSLFQFQYIPAIIWGGSDEDRIKQLMKTFLDGIDFNDTLIVRSRELNKRMSDFMGLFGAKASTYEMRDSIFTEAGSLACDKASKGHPKVYGWMVDYFYNGYETYKIDKGMLMLKKHLENPKCLTTKKQQIFKRLEGMKTLIPGKLSPNFLLNDNENNIFNFHNYNGKTKFKLLLFLSADCNHCEELIESLSKRYSLNENQKLIVIVAVSLDNTESEVKKWNNKILNLSAWKHIRAIVSVNFRLQLTIQF
ncbi:MAG: redoxin domain-containing protein [Bacteroidales bacterium]